MRIILASRRLFLGRTLWGVVLTCFLSLLGCSSQEMAVSWVEGGAFNWVGLNHRISFMAYHLADEGVDLGLVGGASTTNALAELPETCSLAECMEIPWYDSAEVSLSSGHGMIEGSASGLATGNFLANKEGNSVVIDVPLSGNATGFPVVFLRGWSLDTSAPLAGGEACYDPKNGWHVREMSVQMNVVDWEDGGDVAHVKIQGSFEAGPSMEDMRKCVDEVYEEAQVDFSVTVQVLVADGEAEHHDVSHSVEYFLDEYGHIDETGEEMLQPEPDHTLREVPFIYGSGLRAWSALDFKFHTLDPQGRGAYLRSMSFQIGEEDWVSGHATNYSPPTQLSGFDYTFSGSVVELPAVGPIEHRVTSVVLQPELDEEGTPLLTAVDF